MHILFLSDNFPPETNAPATRTYEHAKRWVKDGVDVTVITCAPNFPSGNVHEGYRNKLWSRTYVDGIQVIRVWTYISANEGFLKRTLDYLSFMITASIAALFVRHADIVIGTSPQFFAACAAWIVSVAKRCPFVFELRDLWPSSIVAVGAMKDSLVIVFLRRVEYFLYRRAALIVSVTESFKTVLSRNGVNPERIVVIRNGADVERLTPTEKPHDLLSKLFLHNRFVAAYIGTIGLAHELGTILRAAEILKAQKEIVFVLVGDGAERKRLEQQAKASCLDNVIFVGPVDRAEAIRYWALCDTALVLLRDSPTFREVIPSKIFEAMAMQRSIVLGVAGEAAEIITSGQCGVCIAPESADELAMALQQLSANKGFNSQLGLSGRAFVISNFDRNYLAGEMLAALRRVTLSG
jgi:glycosyltransferase involved in cell wall biosynthesis